MYGKINIINSVAYASVFLGLKITDAIVIVDREQGGKHNIEANGVKLHSLFNLSDLINLYSQENKITEQIASTVREYIASNQVVQDGIVKSITVEGIIF